MKNLKSIVFTICLLTSQFSFSQTGLETVTLINEKGDTIVCITPEGVKKINKLIVEKSFADEKFDSCFVKYEESMHLNDSLMKHTKDLNIRNMLSEQSFGVCVDKNTLLEASIDIEKAKSKKLIARAIGGSIFSFLVGTVTGYIIAIR